MLESQCEQVCRGRNAQGTCGPGGMQPVLDPHEQVGKGQEGINGPTTLSMYPLIFCLAPTMAVPDRKSEGRGNWELPYIAVSLGKSRAEKSDG